MRDLVDARLPEGTVTLLLADVEGSTLLWERDSSAARPAMAHLDALADELIASFGGARPVEQGEGDSFVAGFARASDAIACALAMQQRLADGPLHVRMALHTGEVEVREGSRYDGPTIIRAARIRDLGHGGQVLLSGATRDVVQEALPDGADTIDVGSHTLKGIDRPVHVFQLTHPSLASTFPPLRAVESRPGNLPTRLTTFVGRVQELADVQELAMANRLVTLTGAGGCGKTRLAEEVAGRIADAVPDGVWFCDLGPVADPSAVAQTLRTVIGLSEQPERSDTEVLCRALADARTLVILDNCEHLIDACAALADALLRACPRMHILATSRESLGVDGEVSWRVPSLGTPENDTDDIERYDAVQLFVETAKRARAGFALTSENAPAIAAICSRLDGIPLALELAAARVRVLSVQDIASGLSDRFRLLGRGARTALARHQTLLASVAWSHDLLSDAERIVLRRLAVFAGTFTLEGAEHVASGDDVKPAQVLELVSQLVERSLIVSTDTTTGTRYRMLETLRQFARERLVESGEAKHIATKHLAYYSQWTVRKRSDFWAGRISDSRLAEELDAAYDNLRDAVEWAIVDGHAEQGLRLVTALQQTWVAWRVGTRSREGRRWLDELLRVGTDVSARRRVNALIAFEVQNYSHDNAVEAVALARELGDERLLARALHRAGFAIGVTGDPERGLQLLEEAAVTARACRDDLSLYFALFEAAQVRGFCGEQAITESIEALEIAMRSGGFGEPWSRLALGYSLFHGGDAAGGRREVERALELLQTGDRSWIPKTESLLAHIVAFQGDRELGRELASHAERFTAENDFADAQTAMVMALQALATFAFDDGLVDETERYLDRMHEFVAEHDPSIQASMPGAVYNSSLFSAIRAAVACARDDRDAALAAIGAATDETVPRHPVGLHATWLLCARVARALGELARSETLVHRALGRVADGMRVFGPDTLEVVAGLRADVGADTDAARFYGAADTGRRKMSIVRQPDPLADVDVEIARIRERLGPQTFDEAWTSGAELSIDDAVALAMRGRGPRHRPVSGWDSLTPAEKQVVDLVAEGLTNKQVAERLIMSPRTVSTHLSHVFAKLGVGSRAELAAAAAKRP